MKESALEVIALAALGEKEQVLFVSDLHLGYFSYEVERVRERQWLAFLEKHRIGLRALFLMGDIFDFWYEYREVVPKGFVRLQAYLVALADAGVELHYFTGNHDVFMSSYWAKELGGHLHTHPCVLQVGDAQRFYLAHGDGLGRGDTFYKVCKRFVLSSFFRFFFSWLHPDCGMGIIRLWSRSKRRLDLSNEAGSCTKPYAERANNRLLGHVHALEKHKPKAYDAYLFGHTHVARDEILSSGARFLNLGDGIYAPYVGVLTASGFELCAQPTLAARPKG